MTLEVLAPLPRPASSLRPEGPRLYVVCLRGYELEDFGGGDGFELLSHADVSLTPLPPHFPPAPEGLASPFYANPPRPNEAQIPSCITSKLGLQHNNVDSSPSRSRLLLVAPPKV